ncbi:EF-hand domain-containing protein [Maricaulaceae bacterium MS644]
MTRYSLSAVLAAGLMTTSCAGGSSAEPGAPAMPLTADTQIAPPVGLMFAGLDQDLDGIISAEEISAAAPVMFTASDSNSDGVLTGIEFSQWSERHLGAAHTNPGRFRFDHDQNGRITLIEFETTFDGLRDHFDQNRDGALERTELLVTLNPPDMAAMQAQMQSQMMRRAQEMCRRNRG